MNRQWILAKRPNGKFDLSDLALTETPLPRLAPEAKGFLLRNVMIHCIPAARDWMNERWNGRASIGIGDPIFGPAVGEVIESHDPDFPVGCLVHHSTGWQEYVAIDPATAYAPPHRIPEGVSSSEALSIYSGNALTGYFGIVEAAVGAGETVVVTAAAGHVGSIAAQIARIRGARVIGIAGGAEKCRWLVDHCRLDAAIDYKAEPVRDRLAALCPNGIDVFFDNVGGRLLEELPELMADRGRMLICGQASSYDRPDDARPRFDMMRFVYWRIKLLGYGVGDYLHRADEALADLAAWNDAGLIAHREDLRTGFENLPQGLSDVLVGNHLGPVLVQVAQAA